MLASRVSSVRSASLRAAVASRHASSSSSVSSTTPAPVPLSNIEASWKTLTPAEQEATYKSLEELQKKDWKELSIDEKKASYYVAFGPHGPREPILPSGSGAKTALGVVAAVTVAAGIFVTVRRFGGERPKTLTKEWEEAATARAIEQKMDPFTGPTSEGYKGKGFVH